ncbi:704_t:CDS:2, partial [Entrophospora sp. SA101]
PIALYEKIIIEFPIKPVRENVAAVPLGQGRKIEKAKKAKSTKKLLPKEKEL